MCNLGRGFRGPAPFLPRANLTLWTRVVLISLSMAGPNELPAPTARHIKDLHSPCPAKSQLYRGALGVNRGTDTSQPTESRKTGAILSLGWVVSPMLSGTRLFLCEKKTSKIPRDDSLKQPCDIPQERTLTSTLDLHISPILSGNSPGRPSRTTADTWGHLTRPHLSMYQPSLSFTAMTQRPFEEEP